MHYLLWREPCSNRLTRDSNMSQLERQRERRRTGGEEEERRGSREDGSGRERGTKEDRGKGEGCYLKG